MRQDRVSITVLDAGSSGQRHVLPVTKSAMLHSKSETKEVLCIYRDAIPTYREPDCKQ